MRTAKVNVVPYDAEWKNDFEKIKSEIEELTSTSLWLK